MSSTSLKVGFLGAGKMATALARGFVRAGLVAPADLIASDPIVAGRDAFARETGGRVTVSNGEVPAGAEVVILAVKPDQVAGVLAEWAEVAKRAESAGTRAPRRSRYGRAHARRPP